MAQPLSLKQKLSGNPSQKPFFAVSLQDSVQAADPRATRALVSVMDMHAVIGGAASHYGGPAAFAELMSALFAYVFAEAEKEKRPWYDLYHLVNDAGHCENGLYALKANYQMAGLDFEELKGFRSIDSILTGHGEAHLFPEGVQISNGPLGSAFPQSQGLAMADAFAGSKRVTVTAISDGACMEGEAREAMAAVPGLAARGQMAPFVLVISDNNTKLTGRIDEESFSMTPTFKALETLGWEVIRLEEGNNLQKCFDTIKLAVEKAKANPKKPIAIHARTVKGIGNKKAADSSSGGHGFPLKSANEMAAFLEEIYHGDKVPTEFFKWTEELKAREVAQVKEKPAQPEEKIQVGISAAMSKARKAGLPVVSITSDLPGSTGVAGFRKDFPQASFDVGVAESNMISAAAGFTKAGFIPVVDTFAQFGVTKGALPITMASLSEAPVICVFSHTGFQDAADGASHQALSYLAMLSSIPHVRTVTLSCSEEADALMTEAIQEFADEMKAGRTPPTTVFFLGRENFPKNFGASSYKLGQAQVLKKTAGAKSVCLIPVGSMVGEALKAQAALEKKGIGAVVVHPSTVNELDWKTLEPVVKDSSAIVVVEDHQRIGGYGQFLGAALLEKGVNKPFRHLGVKAQFGQSAYNAIDLYKKHGLDSASVANCAEGLLK
ncbi:MAG: transketolase [Bdellovibrio sp. SCN 50-8]|nr:MAG: transketolase [Bdellovibrio sp. SCN 50-8]